MIVDKTTVDSSAKQVSVAVNDSPVVSVIIPVYNAKRWLEGTLRSVFEQTMDRRRLDLIVVDDGSTDGSYELARDELEGGGFQFELFRVENGGPSRARNVGWRKAKGHWIQFLDADDLLAPNKIQTQIAAMDRLVANVAVIYSDWRWLASAAEAPDKPLGPVKRASVGSDSMSDLLDGANFIPTGSYLLRRDWLEAASGFDETFPVVEDVNLLLRVAMAGGQFQYVPSEQPLFFYRKHQSGSLSTRSRTEFAEGCLRNAQMVEKFWCSRSELTASRIAILANCYLQAARYFAAVDRERFARLAHHLADLIPGFVPQEPTALRLLSELVGYPRAERISVVYRALKRAIPHLTRNGASDAFQRT